MLEFITISIIKPNKEIIKSINTFSYKIINGKVKVIKNTNLKVIEPIIYLIYYPTRLSILEYQVNEIQNKNFYIKEYKKKYNIKEIKQLLVKLNKNHWL